MKRKNIYHSHMNSDFSVRILIMSILCALSIFLLVPAFNTLRNISLDKKKTYNVVKFKTTEKEKIKREKKMNNIKQKKIPRMINVKRKLTPLSIEAEIPTGASIFKGDFKSIPSFIGELDITIPVFEISEVDQPPVLLSSIPPEYPIMARKNGIEGEVVLLVEVDSSGKIQKTEVISSRPGKVFINNSVNCVKNWKFKPAVKNGKKVNVKVEIPLKYKLD